jgi:ABC-2 type transport system ATP-binding protein
MSETNEAVIEARSLTIRYGRATAVEDLSLTVERGAVYALLGRNGAGKSSLVRVLLGMQPAAAGSSRLFGLDSWARRAKIMGRTGYVPETPDAPPRATTEELVRFCGRVEKTWDGAACRERLARAHIPLHQQFGSLSKGQQRLVSLALALGSRPELLILDDPTLGLDVVASRTLFEEVITELAERGVTMFLTTHDLSGVERIATHVGVMKDARLVVDEPVESLKARFRRIRATGADLPERLPAGVHLVTRRAAAVGEEVVVTTEGDAPGAELSGTGAEVEAMSLEEIFVALTGDEGEAAA